MDKQKLMEFVRPALQEMVKKFFRKKKNDTSQYSDLYK